MKKILLLGAAQGFTPYIKRAKELGYYIITCDNNLNNPGHKFADEYYEVSLLDKDEILKLGKKLKIDGICCYAYDRGIETTAYVAEKMGLPGPPLKSVEILINKDLFRKFLEDNGFNSPKAKGYTNINEAINDWRYSEVPVVIKPVDSGAAMGINKLYDVSDDILFADYIKYALSHSKKGRFIVEEFLELPQLEGDLFSVNGELKFICLGNEYFKHFSIIGTTFPNNIKKSLYSKMQKEIQRIINILNMSSSVYSTEIQYSNNDIFFMEFTPRNGGIDIPQTIKYSTGIDLVEYTTKLAVGDNIDDLYMVEPYRCCAFYNIYSSENGILKSIEISDELKKNNILELHIFKKIGDKVENYIDLSKHIGRVIMKFSSQDEMHYKIQNMDKYIKVVTEQNRTEQNRTEQNRTEQNRTEQNRTEQF